MSTQIQLKRSKTSNRSPELAAGEPFYNLTDKKLFIGHDGENIDARKHVSEVTKTSTDNTDTVKFSVGEATDNTFEQKINNVEHSIASDTADEAVLSIATNLKGGFAGASIGGITNGEEITSETINELLRKLLKVSDGITPHSFSISNNNSDVDIELNSTSTTIGYKWFVQTGTLSEGTIYIRDGDTTEVSKSFSDRNSTTARTGTVSNKSVSVPANANSVTVSRKCMVNTYDLGTKTFTLNVNRVVFYGPNRSAPSASEFCHRGAFNTGKTFEFGAGTPYIEWPSYWGTSLTSVVDQNGFDCTADWTVDTATVSGYTRFKGKDTALNTMSYTFKI